MQVLKQKQTLINFSLQNVVSVANHHPHMFLMDRTRASLHEENKVCDQRPCLHNLCMAVVGFYSE